VSETKRRAWLYGMGVVMVGGLLAAAALYRPGPDLSTRLNGASMLAGMGQIDAALVECDKILREDPDNFEALVFRATFLAMAARHDEAIRAFDQAIACAAPSDEEVKLDLRVDRASVLAEAGRWAEFERERKQLEGRGHRADLLAGLAAFKKEQWDEAVLAYRRVVEKAPDNEQLKGRYWNALVRRGDAALAAGRFAVARQSYATAAPLVDNAGVAYRKLAEVCLAEGNPAAAIVATQKAGPGTPGIGTVVFRAATQLVEAGDRAGALAALDGALAVDEAAVRVLLAKDPVWAELRTHPEVQKLLDLSQDRGRRE